MLIAQSPLPYYSYVRTYAIGAIRSRKSTNPIFLLVPSFLASRKESSSFTFCCYDNGLIRIVYSCFSSLNSHSAVHVLDVVEKVR